MCVLYEGEHVTIIPPRNALLCTRSMSCSWPYLTGLHSGGVPGRRLTGLNSRIAFVMVCTDSRACCDEEFARLSS
jgi:hypothetical protein